MNTHKHVKPDQLEKLLNGEASEQQTSDIASHVEDCAQCRGALDELAAEPDLWKKASELITERYFSDTVTVNSSFEVVEHQSSQETPQDKRPWDYPVEQMFDRPTHPEMLGNVGVYGIEREVGRGGMGVVFKAHDHELNRPVAIKVLAPHLAANGAARKRFAREARAAAAVLHPNVIAIHGVSGEKERPYIVMSYIAGPSLQLLVEQNGPLELKEMVRITLQISGGLTAAHSQGVIHRDVKPANILIEQGVSRVVITDFGLARAENDATMTQTGFIAGTPNFMSPEQAFGKSVDGRSDLFSLGSVMYFMATGRMPFRAGSPMAVLNRICNDTPTPIRDVNSDVSETYSDIVEKLLAKEPDERFQSAAELHQTLEQYLTYLHQPNIAKPPVVKERPASWANINQSWLAAVACVVLLFSCLWAASSGWFRTKNGTAPVTTVYSDSGDSPVAEPGDTISLYQSDLQSFLDENSLVPESEIQRELRSVESEIHLLSEQLFDLDSLLQTLPNN